jgi:hypothetical protein
MARRALGGLMAGMIAASWPAASGRAAELLYEIHGADKVGWSVAGIGDVDGDTVPDFAAGAPEAGPDFGIGEIRVFSGADGAPVAALDGVLLGLQGAGFLGRSLAPAGDLDGDTVPDILAGASSVSTASALPGYVVVFSGADGSVLLRIDGVTAPERFGDAVASVGDVDGDDVPDVLVGAPGGTGIAAGSVQLYSGADGTLIRRHDAETPVENLGDSVAGLGDVDGDGIGDYAVGAPRFGGGTGVEPYGYVKVFSGANGAQLARIQGKKSEQLGWNVRGPGDLDGDGHPDLLASAIKLAGRGGVLGFDLAGPRPRKILSIVWPFEGKFPFFGTALAGIPDVTGDGLPDVAIGAEGAGLVGVFAGRGGLPVFAHFAESADVVGDSVASGGDMTGDGLPELIVGGWGASVVRVFSLDEVTPPKKIKSKVVFTPTGAGEGTVTFSVKGKKVGVKLKVTGLPAGIYTLVLEDAPGSGSFFAVAEVEVSSSGSGKLSLKAKAFAPEPLKVLSLLELEGRRVQLRDGGGAVVMEAAVPQF